MLNDSIQTIRYDNHNLDTLKLTKTTEGYLEGYAIATRTGVFNYMKADGSIQRELRLAEDVFKEDAINSFKLLPITNDHPAEEVNSTNVKELAVGFTGEDIQKQDNYLLTKLKITDKDTIDAINNGKRGLSYGYKVNLIKKDGVHKGKKYDYIQTDIKGNHLAVVSHGRAGNKARLKLDGQEAICVLDDYNNNENNFNMKTIKIDNKDYEVVDEVVKRLDTLEANNSNLKDEGLKLQNKIDSLAGERDALKDKIIASSKEDNSEEIAKKVKERISLEKQASTILKHDDDISNLSDKDIKIKVISKVSPKFNIADKNDSYIDARYDTCIDLQEELNLAKNMSITGNRSDTGSTDSISNQYLQQSLINKSINK